MRPVGRPPYQPTDKHRDAVRAMVGYGVTHEEVARALNVVPKTLRKYYRHELDTGATIASAAVAQSLFWMATEGKNVAAAIYWLRCRAGWKPASDSDAPPRATVIRIEGGLPHEEPRLGSGSHARAGASLTTML